MRVKGLRVCPLLYEGLRGLICCTQGETSMQTSVLLAHSLTPLRIHILSSWTRQKINTTGLRASFFA